MSCSENSGWSICCILLSQMSSQYRRNADMNVQTLDCLHSGSRFGSHLDSRLGAHSVLRGMGSCVVAQVARTSVQLQVTLRQCSVGRSRTRSCGNIHYQGSLEVVVESIHFVSNSLPVGCRHSTQLEKLQSVSVMMF